MGKHETTGMYWSYRREDGYLGVVKAASEDAATALLKFLPYGFTLLPPHTISLDEAHERIDSERHRNV